MTEFVVVGLRLKPNVGWWMNCYPDDDPDRITRPIDRFYESETAARNAAETWINSRFPGAEVRFRRGPDIPA